MSNRFSVPDDPPSTPDRSSRSASHSYRFGDNPSTTPAEPPPSSSASFTPAGAPSASYLGSSIMRGVPSQKPASFNSRLSNNSSKNLFVPKTNSPLGRSISAAKGRQPSRLSRQFVVDDEEEDEGDEAEEEDDDEIDTRRPPKTFEVQYDGESPEGSEEDHEGYDEEEDAMEGAEYAEADDTQADLWLNMGQDLLGTAQLPILGDESDLMMLATPAVNDRIRREAEDIFRISTMRSSGRRRPREFKFATVAKSMYDQMGFAPVTEPAKVVLETEALVSRLYHDGVGTEDDAERLDKALGDTSARLVALWQAQVDELPRPDEEHAAGVGPGPHAGAFENAAYLATLALRVNHTRFNDDGQDRMQPLTETMFQWLVDYHNVYPSQVHEVLKYRHGSASHGMFWQTIFAALLQGRVAEAIGLLRAGGWQNIRRGDQPAYAGRVLANVVRAVQETADMLEACPGRRGDWDIWNSDWTLFRIQAKGALDQLRRFAEGRSQGDPPAASLDPRHSLAGLARKAESQVPWDVYENLNIIFDIAVGSRDRILAISQDWCEATVGLFGWWDEGRHESSSAAAGGLQASSHSQSLMRLTAGGPQATNWESYLDRLARSFHHVIDAGLEINSNSPLEAGMACVLEDNPKGVIGILRAWSLPVATAVAEIASLGGWLPPHQPSPAFGMEELDREDLDVLGLDTASPDDLDGIKDNTLVQYAQALVNWQPAPVEAAAGSSREALDGWELAIRVLGRMESPERSEETVGELVRTILDEIDVDSGSKVERVWSLLNDLGMIVFAEETAEHYGEILAQGSHRYGEAMWYYALAHRPSKVREVMNLLISYSLIQSTAFPPADELDDHLGRLLRERNATLEAYAKRDLEAANLVGRMLSGYATLRRFYDIRDDESLGLARRRALAAPALVAVIASADDNIRGGLYDADRDAVVSEDFLLALLGEALALTTHHHDPHGPPPPIGLDGADILLKAVEDLQSIEGSRVQAACDEFFHIVLQSAPGLKGSSPADLMRMSTSIDSGGLGGSSYVLSGSSMVASMLHRSLSGAAAAAPGRPPPPGLGGAAVERGWDWRTGMNAKSTAADVVRLLRLGLSRDLARLWILDADGSGRGF